MQRQMHFLRVPQQIGSRGENQNLSPEFPRPAFTPSRLKEDHILGDGALLMESLEGI